MSFTGIFAGSTKGRGGAEEDTEGSLLFDCADIDIYVYVQMDNFFYLGFLGEQEELRKAERKNRDEFRKLMEEHLTEGTLTFKTQWRDYCMKVNIPFPLYL